MAVAEQLVITEFHSILKIFEARGKHSNLGLKQSAQNQPLLFDITEVCYYQVNFCTKMINFTSKSVRYYRVLLYLLFFSVTQLLFVRQVIPWERDFLTNACPTSSPTSSTFYVSLLSKNSKIHTFPSSFTS
jgi:hypothetical protein